MTEPKCKEKIKELRATQKVLWVKLVEETKIKPLTYLAQSPIYKQISENCNEFNNLFYTIGAIRERNFMIQGTIKIDQFTPSALKKMMKRRLALRNGLA